jgi:mycothiol system anti-sigma-R factor
MSIVRCNVVVCESKGRLLHGYLDGELDAVRAVEFEEHLKACTECAGELREQQDLRQSLRAANLYERAPESLRSRIRTQISGGQAENLHRKLIPMPRRAVFNWLAAAAAIAVAILGGAEVVPHMVRQHQTDLLAQEMVASHIRSLQPGHLFDVQSTDQHTVKPWFDGKLDFAPPVVDFAQAGFPLIGGRLDYANGRPVAALVYGRQKHLINVFVWPAQSNPSELTGIRTIQGYNLVFWWHDGMDFCAASDLNVAELREFVQLLER